MDVGDAASRQYVYSENPSRRAKNAIDETDTHIVLTPSPYNNIVEQCFVPNHGGHIIPVYLPEGDLHLSPLQVPAEDCPGGTYQHIHLQSDRDARIEAMDRAGVALTIISLTMPALKASLTRLWLSRPLNRSTTKFTVYTRQARTQRGFVHLASYPCKIGLLQPLSWRDVLRSSAPWAFS